MRRPGASRDPMIYCVVPTRLAFELYDGLADRYTADPGVLVIVDRRRRERRRRGAHGGGRRHIRDRRRARVPGEFPSIDAP